MILKHVSHSHTVYALEPVVRVYVPEPSSEGNDLWSLSSSSQLVSCQRVRGCHRSRRDIRWHGVREGGYAVGDLDTIAFAPQEYSREGLLLE